ncbi:uncharacterized protein LOC113351325 [Papaver somniferum]|uniref:uncharacterized protein LOC113351325 n=1 Tax=Papaver somniferum TaxID=3469 RepID=UPI000E6FC78F|nr:uncharacterized protein LOC113351325 [Papaver somniferum]
MEIVDHFSSLFNSTNTSLDHDEIERLFPNIISDSENNSITREVSIMEIKNVMRQLGSMKALGPDGLQGIFFHKYWDIVGPSIIKLVKDFFPHGRSIFDSTIICNEIVHSFKTKKGVKVGWPSNLILIKRMIGLVGLLLLKYLNIADKVVNWIITYISSVAFQVLKNGAPSEEFTPRNGIRQGDPLSPFIIILCLEALSRLLQQGIDSKYLQGFTVAKGAPMIAHSMYADDSIIFLKANYNNACNLRQILEKFSRWYGQVISDAKSTLLTSSNLGRSFTMGMARALKVQVASTPGKYSGIPLQWGRLSENTFHDLLENLSNRMIGWKSKSLNIAGRSVLIKSVLDHVWNHVMAILKLPKGLVNKIDKFRRNFLCGGDKGSRKMHNVNWSTVCSPIVQGGLGIRDLGYDDFWTSRTKNGCSTSWRSLVKGKDIIKNSLEWCISDGIQVDFWNDPWINDIPLSAITDMENVTIPSLRVKDVINPSTREWDLFVVDSFVSEEVKENIYAMPVTASEGRRDKRVWAHGKDGGASTDSLYAGIGGVVRDDVGAFVAGYTKHIYQNGSNMVEVWAERDGLQLVVQLGIRKPEVECDSLYTIQLCRGEVSPLWYLRGLIQDIEELSENFEDLVFIHQHRESNFVADTFSKKASEGLLEGHLV